MPSEEKVTPPKTLITSLRRVVPTGTLLNGTVLVLLNAIFPKTDDNAAGTPEGNKETRKEQVTEKATGDKEGEEN